MLDESGHFYFGGIDFPKLSRRWLVQNPNRLLKKETADVKDCSFGINRNIGQRSRQYLSDWETFQVLK